MIVVHCYRSTNIDRAMIASSLWFVLLEEVSVGLTDCPLMQMLSVIQSLREALVG